MASVLSGKNVLIGISGGIAAYKAPFLIRLLVKKGCNVKVTATDNALKFVTPLTLQTLSGNTVYNRMFDLPSQMTTEHITLAQWADCFVIAPATADIIGKYASGIADDALSTVLLAFEKDVFVCPAMNSAMYFNKSVQRNLTLLQQDGVHIIDSDEGFLACGTTGKGRMAEPEEIVEKLEQFYGCNNDLNDKTVTVTAGPTRESIDSVRFISNNSSGKMGLALAYSFIRCGAKVNLVAGPLSEKITPLKGLNVINTVSAEDMYKATVDVFDTSDITVCAAAVADYTPKEKHTGKLKKKEDNLLLNLVPTKDILAELGKRKKPSQILVGFALETDNELENAKLKLLKKNLDMILLNSLKDEGAGFEVDTNKVTAVKKSGEIISMPLKSKREVADDIVNLIKEFL
ncbi:MAG: bifunctional phosphopantothenoylcysteine decarboxylase/phosphopantothenate--cysteine ligase CoaBC [Bacteroidales bacterium]|nr:bifunctional phosphopantothenoylcysteine decarboxylase/phosphopantothenate--cysteine ligase CoaBC [Bacteroidales bacterium]